LVTYIYLVYFIKCVNKTIYTKSLFKYILNLLSMSLGPFLLQCLTSWKRVKHIRIKAQTTVKIWTRKFEAGGWGHAAVRNSPVSVKGALDDTGQSELYTKIVVHINSTVASFRTKTNDITTNDDRSTILFCGFWHDSGYYAWHEIKTTGRRVAFGSQTFEQNNVRPAVTCDVNM
jgi:hypothetical protein